MADRFTNFECKYILDDTTASEDAVFTTSSNQSFGDVSLLVEDYSSTAEYMTLERNHSILDGSLDYVPNEPENVAFFSAEMSDENGLFENNPTITIDFSRTHSSIGLTFFFLYEHPLEAEVTWYKFDGSILNKRTTDITSNTFAFLSDVENYQKILISFTKALPYHYIKLYCIEFGYTFIWNENNVKTAKLTQEMDKISDKISINQLSFEVVDVGDELNMGNSTGMHRYFQRNQVLIPYEVINDRKVQLGQFYLKEFSESSDLGKMVWQSSLGLLDSITYDQGDVYDGTFAGIILDDIFTYCGIADYEVEEEVYRTPLYGALKPMTARNALREVLFATGSVIDTTGDNIIYIKKPSIKITDGKLTRNTKIETKTSQREYHYGVTIKYSDYVLDTNQSQVLKGKYPAGTNRVNFTMPVTDLSIDNGTIESSGKFFCVFTLAEESDIIIVGNKYTATSNSITVTQDRLEAGQTEKIKSYNSALCNAVVAKNVASNILTHLNHKLQFTIKNIADDIDMDGWHFVDNPSRQFREFIAEYTKRNIDLTGGFIDSATMIGYYREIEPYFYAGSELWANNDSANGGLI